MRTPATASASFVQRLALASIGFMAIAWYFRTLPSDELPEHRLQQSEETLRLVTETSSMRGFTNVMSAGGAGSGFSDGEAPASVKQMVDTQVLEKVRKIDPKKLGNENWYSRCPTGYYVYKKDEDSEHLVWLYDLAARYDCDLDIMAEIVVYKKDHHIAIRPGGKPEITLDTYLASLK